MGYVENIKTAMVQLFTYIMGLSLSTKVNWYDLLGISSNKENNNSYNQEDVIIKALSPYDRGVSPHY